MPGALGRKLHRVFASVLELIPTRLGGFDAGQGVRFFDSETALGEKLPSGRLDFG
jgi:hypothetical protein